MLDFACSLSEMGQKGEKYSINMQKKQQNEEIPSPDINVPRRNHPFQIRFVLKG